MGGAGNQAGPQVQGRRKRWVCYFDADCRFCDRVVKGLSRLDFFGQVTWTPYQNLEEPPPGLSLNELGLAAYLDTGQGRLHQGFYAFRMLSLRLLPLVPLAPFLWFPGVNLVGVAVYRWVARNRYPIYGCRMPVFKTGRRSEPPLQESR